LTSANLTTACLGSIITGLKYSTDVLRVYQAHGRAGGVIRGPEAEAQRLLVPRGAVHSAEIE